MRRLARNNAVLAKILDDEALVIDDLSFEDPQDEDDGRVAGRRGGRARAAVLALKEPDNNVYLSGRNVPKTDVKLLQELNAYEILRRRKLVLSRPAFEALVADPVTLQRGGKASPDASPSAS